MKAAVLHEYGSVPQVEDFADPEAGDGEVVVEVVAAGMNPVELAIASGRFYGLRPELPAVVGREAVVRDPEGVSGYVVGCVPPHGTMAERSVVARERLIPLPTDLDPAVAVGLGTAGLAGWMPFKRSARLQPGESVLVLGASGAVGQIAVQTARLLGASTVVAATRSAAGGERALELGADAAVGLTGEELSRAAGDGFDLILDLLWGAPAVAALGTIARFGRMVQVGNAAATEVTLAAPLLRSRCASVMGYTSALLEPAELRAGYLELVDHAVAGRLAVDVERIALDEVATAWSRQANGPRRKLVVVP